MKKLITLTLLSLFIIGCNMNPSKEARIQELENEVEISKEKTDSIENRIQKLEGQKQENQAPVLQPQSENQKLDLKVVEIK